MGKGILSFGGAFSNHLHALAYFCYIHNIPLIVLIRSYDPNPDTPTLKDIKNWGADIQILPPELYRRKEDADMVRHWNRLFPDHLILPEGGSHRLALQGVHTMMNEIYYEIIDVDYYIVPVGTGATMAGMIQARKDSEMIVGISALKTSQLYHHLKYRWELDKYTNWMTAEQWHWGGYGKTPDKLITFSNEFQSRHKILLDPFYNGKAMYALFQYLRYELIPPGAVIVFIHTGGLQGWRGIERTMW